MENQTNYAILRHCIECDFKCFKQSDWDRHTSTTKHKNRTLLNNFTPFYAEKKQIFMCDICNKEYKVRNSLWYHKKKCNISHVTVSNDELFDKDKDKLILMLITQNTELIKETSEFKNIMLEQQNMMMAQHTSTQNMMMDVIKTGTHNTTNNTNSHNKTFNLNFFLNETCKNALNIDEFVSSIKVSLDDLENTGRQGYVEGISNIILQKLQNLNHYDRPIHCADQKREILYIKNDNQWIKEGEEKPLLIKAIKTIANENIKQIKTWRDKNPDCTASDSKKNNLYLKIVSNSMNGSTVAESDKNINKIISNVVKETIIPKET
jgi:hypothetical protein